MPIDTSIYQNIRPVQMPDLMDTASKAMGLNQLGMQNQALQKKLENDDRDSKLEYAKKIQAHTMPTMDYLAGLPEEERATAYPSVMKKLQSEGVPMDNVPKDAMGNFMYDPQHFSASYNTLKNTDLGLSRQKSMAEINQLQAKVDPIDKDLGRQKTKAEIAKLYAEAGKTKDEKVPNQSQFAAATYGTRANQAENVFSDLAQKGFDPTSFKNAIKSSEYFPEGLKDENVKRQSQAERNFVNSILRRESGAAISKDEFTNAESQYFPRSGDTQEVLRQKEENRKTAAASLNAEGAPAMGRLAQSMSGMSLGSSVPLKKRGGDISSAGMNSAQASTMPKHGTKEDGYVFMGGDPSDQKNWKRAK